MSWTMQRARAEGWPAAARAVRTVSLVAAVVASLALMLFPFLLRHVPVARLHTALPIVLFGVAGAWVHGLGYRADSIIVGILFGPLCVWAMIFVGAALLFAPY